MLALICFLLFIYYFYRKYSRFYLLLYKIPTYAIGPAVFKFQLKDLFNYLKSLSSFASEKKGVAKFWLGPFPLIVVTNPEDAETVLNSCLSKGYVYRFSKPWVGQGLVTSKASVWKRHIKKLSPAFNQRVLDGFLSIFNKQAQTLVEKLSHKTGGQKFDIYPYIGAANLETICQTAMGTPMDLQESPNHPYLEAIESILQIITKRSSTIWLQINTFFNWTKYKTRQDNAIEILHGVSNTVIKKKKADLDDQNKNNSLISPTFKAFLDLMLDLNSQEQVFTDLEIREQVDTMIAAGHETSSHVLLYTLLMIGSKVDVQDRVYKEILDVIGQDEVKKEDLNKLIYLEAVIKESMRLYPVVPMVFRYIDKELKLKDYTIPKGCNCGVSIWSLNRHESWGDDVEKFRPERWLETIDKPRHPASFATFSFGRRVCLGKTYAMMSLKTMLSHLLRRYEFVSDTTKMKLHVNFVLKPVAGHLVKLKTRQQ